MGAVVSDVREGGQWTVAQRIKNLAIYLAVSAAIAVASWFSPRALRAGGRCVGTLAHALLPGSRRIARRNVARVFPSLPERERHALVKRSYQTLGEHLGDAFASLDARRRTVTLPFAPGARETLDAAVAAGHGVVLASAHLGPWETVAATLVANGPFSAVAREAYDPRLMRLYERLRGARGVPTIYRGAPGSGARLLRMLRQGGVLGIPMDLASRVASVDVPFLGHLARTPVGPARLALRTGARVVVGVAAPRADGSGQLELAITDIDTSGLLPSPDGERELSTRINDVLSASIRALPASWPWMHPRW